MIRQQPSDLHQIMKHTHNIANTTDCRTFCSSKPRHRNTPTGQFCTAQKQNATTGHESPRKAHSTLISRSSVQQDWLSTKGIQPSPSRFSGWAFSMWLSRQNTVFIPCLLILATCPTHPSLTLKYHDVLAVQDPVSYKATSALKLRLMYSFTILTLTLCCLWFLFWMVQNMNAKQGVFSTRFTTFNSKLNVTSGSGFCPQNRVVNSAAPPCGPNIMLTL